MYSYMYISVFILYNDMLIKLHKQVLVYTYVHIQTFNVLKYVRANNLLAVFTIYTCKYFSLWHNTESSAVIRK